jgi:hypothetical protein
MVCEDGSCHPATALGPSCASGDPDQICLGVKTVAYLEGGQPQVTQEQTLASIAGMNATWAQCKIGFQLEQYEQANPSDHGLASGSAAASQTDAIRRAFTDASHLLIVVTGAWGTVKNAWTQLPGFDTHGAIFESSVADYPQIWAHEIGHYLSLDHAGDAMNVMSAIIYPNSTQLTSSQCDAARASATRDWAPMLRG